MVLLKEERLAGATLLVLANKQDLPGALSAQEIKDVSRLFSFYLYVYSDQFGHLIPALCSPPKDPRVGQHKDAPLERRGSQCGYWGQTIERR